MASERAAELFDRLADLEPEEAERVLRLECGDDLPLARTVAALLAHDRQVDRDFLAPVAPMAPAEHPSEPRPSSHLGRYHVLDKVGEGGMGSVYIGYDEGLDRKVALKVVHGAARRDWLRREGQALARLAHPNVVSIYEVGDQDGIVFLAMELIEGPTLREWRELEPRSFTDILRMFRQAGRGLVAVHEAGLLHRDFKPDNVLVGADGRAKVADFGLASLGTRDEETAEGAAAAELSPSFLERPLTQRGAFFGTPAYMAPELLAGARATAASDQWSFSVALYRAVYGVAPFTPEALRAGDSGGPLVFSPPPRADVPAWLGPILSTGLARDPARRFPSMSRLLAAIDEHVPADPELDPTVVSDERRRLTVIFALSYLAHGVALAVPSLAQAILRPAAMLAFPLASLVVVAGLVASRWRHLARNRYGRRLAQIFSGFPVMVLLSRLICLRLGLMGGQILTMDSFVLGVAFAFIARDELRWLGGLAALHVLQAGAAATLPDHAILVSAAGNLLTFLAICARAFADRHIVAESALGDVSHADERRG